MKILLVHLYSNGDCLFATTIAKQIKKDFPGCHLTWAVASFCKSILAGNPDVDELMEVTSVKKNDTAAFRKFKKEVLQKKASGEFDEVFITHNQDVNQALYDGTIRSGILRSYPYPVTVSKQPVLILSDSEKEKTKLFAEKHQILQYKKVILFEYAPLSGQLAITKEDALYIAEKIAEDENTAVVLSSANKISHLRKNIIDGSELTLRETAALTHYCTFLLGCSSGITWISTSSAAKELPMIQMLDANAVWVNPISRDFERIGKNTGHVIEMMHFNRDRIVECIRTSLRDFSLARAKYNEPVPLQFRTTKKIVYNLLVYGEFAAIAKHIKINKQVWGNNPALYKAFILGLLSTPFKLIRNLIVKRF